MYSFFRASLQWGLSRIVVITSLTKMYIKFFIINVKKIHKIFWIPVSVIDGNSEGILSRQVGLDKTGSLLDQQPEIVKLTLGRLPVATWLLAHGHSWPPGEEVSPCSYLQDLWGIPPGDKEGKVKGKAAEEIYIYVDQEGGTFDPAISGCAVERGPEVAVPGPDVRLCFYQSSNDLQSRGG